MKRVRSAGPAAGKGPAGAAPRGRGRPRQMTVDGLGMPTIPIAAGAASDEVEGRIYKTVFDSVMNQRLAPGTKLPEAALCKLFGVSRSVVRSVLHRLAHDRIVELRLNHGAAVAVPTLEETRQVFEARRALEAAIVPLAIQRATRADIAALRRQLAEEHGALNRSDQPGWVRLASSFHLRLAELSGNAVLQRYLFEIMSRCSLIVARYEPPGNAACEHDEHGRIVDLIERGDAAGAIRVMDRHLRDLEKRIALRREQPDNSLARMLGMA